MNKETIRKIFDFLQKKENKKHKDRDNFIWKLKFNEPLTKEDLIVNDDLDLSETYIKSLPKGLKVYGDLHIRRTRLKKYKYDELIEMIKPGFIFGNILS